MVEIAEAHEDGDYDYFLAQQCVLNAAFSSSLRRSTKTVLFCRKPPERSKLIIELMFIISTL